MPVGRIILKSISGSKKLSKVKTDGARLLYTWLIPHLDINGCFSGDPVVINGQILSRLNKTIDTVEAYLSDLQANHLIIRYAADGDDFVFVPDFVKRQPKLRPEKEAKPTIPLPTREQIDAAWKDKKPSGGGGGGAPPSPSPHSYAETSKELSLSKLLLDLIRDRNPGFKAPTNLQSWAKQISEMIRVDKRDPQKIEDVIKWCQADSWWQNNVLSTKKLREKFDQLYMKMPKQGQQQAQHPEEAQRDTRSPAERKAGMDKTRKILGQVARDLEDKGK